MSYQIMLLKFEQGKEADIPFEQFESLLKPYGCLSKHNDEWCFISDSGEICDNASLLGDFQTSIYGIMFDRPTMHEHLPQIIFDLLGIENTCFFGTEMEFLQSRSNMKNHLPQIFQEIFPDGPEIISDPVSAWPLK